MKTIVDIATVVGSLANVIMVWIQGKKRHERRKIAAQCHDPIPKSTQVHYRQARPERRHAFSEERTSVIVAPSVSWWETNQSRRVVITREWLFVHEARDNASRQRPSFLSRLLHWRQRVTPETVPSWALELMPRGDAERYTQEWGAHLHQLLEEGELKQAKRDRRRLALAAVSMAIALRVRRVLGRARS